MYRRTVVLLALASFGAYGWPPRQDTPHWSLVNECSEGSLSFDPTRRPGAVRLSAARIGTSYDARLGMAESGPSVVKGVAYDVAFDAYNEGRHVGLVFSLESLDGRRVLARITLPEVGGDWAHYTVALVARDSASKSRLVVAPIEPTTVWLDQVTVSARNAPKK